MALIQPNSRIDFLTGVPFDPSYENTMYFDDLNQQVSYFDTKMSNGLSVERSSYTRSEIGYLKVGWVVDTYGQSVINQMYNVNYMRFKNTNFENKWFYAFVDRVVYINNNTVGVYYHLDVLQTWHFDYSFNQCFIDRQHTVTDRLGANTIPENIELGDYVMDTPTEFTYEPCAIVVTAGDFGGNYAGGVVVPGLETKGNWFSGVHFYPYVLTDASAVTALNNMLEAAYTDRNRLNTIIAVFVMPNTFASTPVTPREYTESVITPGVAGYHLGNYPVRNAKLMTYPYNMLYVTNYQGNHNELHFEYFSDPTNCKLKVWGNLSVNPAMCIYPNNYKVTGDNFDEMMQLTGYPMCAWANDAYKAWVAQNAGTINLAVAGVAASWVRTGIMAKNYFGEVSNAEYASGKHSTTNPVYSRYGRYVLPNLGRDEAISNASSGVEPSGEALGQSLSQSLMATGALIARMRDHAVAPPTSHGNGNGNLQYQMGKMTFMWCHKHIRAEYAAIVDDFFDMYGYAVHRIGIPNRNARPCYTYVKTTDCSVDGNVPVSDLKIIENIFNNGVRFWRTSASFGVYDVAINNNAPIN